MPLTLATPTYKATRRAAQTRVYRDEQFPAPSGGLDLSNPLTDMNPRSALLLDNVFCRRSGNELRKGNKRHVTNLGGALTPSPVRSVMAYYPPRGFGSVLTPKLFAACANGNIYDVTDPQNEAFVPPVSVTIPGQNEPGEFSWTNFSTGATNFLVICSAGGGVWTFDSVGGWIDRTGGIITNPAGRALVFDFVMSWKNRLWFIEDNTADAWYLPTNAIGGNANVFDFGPLLVHGGDLKAIASWTVDGGEGIDDKLVLFAQGGDILIYEGTDPNSANTFRIIGRWYAGRPPSGRRFASKYAGDLAFVTEQGVEYMSRLLQARGELDPETQPKDPARQFNEIIGRDVRATRGQSFWRLINLPSEEAVILLTPYNTGPQAFQYCFGPLPQAWSRMVGMEMASAEEFDGNLFYGTVNGTIQRAFDGTTDDELSDGTMGADVVANIQTAYLPPHDDRMSLKRPLLINPLFQSSSPPSIKAQINTEWDTKGVPGSAPYTPNLDAKWDSAKWDQATWGGSQNSYQAWLGAEGLGSYFSLRMSFTGPPGTLFTSWKVLYEPGGPM